MKKTKQKIEFAGLVLCFLFALIGTAWSQISLPTAMVSGQVNTTAADLTFSINIIRFDYVDGGFAADNGPDESAMYGEVVISGATRTGPTSFTDASFVIRNQSDSYQYLTAQLQNIVFVDLFPGDPEFGGQYYYLNMELDSTISSTLNLHNVVLNTDAAHPSRFIEELRDQLGVNNILGMKLGFFVDVSNGGGDIAGTSTGDIFDGLIDGVSYLAPPSNTPPVADAGATTTNTKCLATSCTITLNGSQSTDPDGISDIVSYEWFENNLLIASGVTASVTLPLGTHEITLKVTDSAGNTDDVTITVVIDPKELSFIDIDSAYVKHNGLVKITGKVALPAGISYLGINSIGRATVGISSLGNVINQSVDFTEFGNKSKWRYDANPVFGIEEFKIDWSGAKFNYLDSTYNLRMKTHHIGESDTSLQIQSCAAVTIVINGVTVNIDRSNIDRNKRATCSNASAKMDRDNDGEDDDRDDDHGDKDDDDHNNNCTTNVTLPFALSPEMMITITHGTVTESISVADYYTAAVGKYKLMGRFDATGIVLSTLNPNLSLTVALGDQGFSGTLVVDQATWTKIRSNQWVYDPN